MKNILLLYIALLSASLWAQQITAQTAQVYGNIILEKTKEPVAYATVTVLQTQGNGRDSLITGTFSSDKGDFYFKSLPPGNFKLNISYVGCKDLVNEFLVAASNGKAQDLGTFTMAEDALLLDAVEIRAEKALTTMSLEKRVYNVEKNLTAAGGTAEDILKNVPSVTVDMDGSVKLRDKSTTIYIDGKPTLLALNQIASDQITSVEVISNPSAKYEASTSGGILNIVLKKNRALGYNGIVSAGAGTQDRYNGMLNLNFNNEKWAVSGFYSVNSSDIPVPAFVNRSNLNGDGTVQSYYNQNSNINYRNFFQSGRVNVDYTLNRFNTFSVAGTVSNGLFNIPVSQRYQFLSAENEISSYGTRQTLSENDFRRNSIEASWNKSYAAKNKSLSAVVNYGWGDKKNISNWNTNGYDADGNVLANYPELVKINDANTNDQILFQLDFVNPLNDSTKIEMGARSFWNIRDQFYYFNPFDYTRNDYVLDTLYSQDSRIAENINAAYFLFTSRLKKQINYQLGLRFEASGMNGISRLAGQSDFGYHFPQKNGKDILNALFPSLSVSKELNSNSEIGFNFSKKIQRPRPNQFMPGIKANDQQNIQVGNPSLQPEFVNLAELNYNKRFGANNWLGSLYLSNETNTIKPLLQPLEADPSILVTSFVNGKNELTYGLDNTLRLALGKKVDITLNNNTFRFNVTVDTFTNSGWASNSKIGLNYRMPYNFLMQLNGAYEGNRPMPQGSRKGIAYMDFAVKKSFLHNTASIVFSIGDVFNTRKEVVTYQLQDYVQESMQRRDTRYYKLTVQIPFGKTDSASAKKSSKKMEKQEMPEF